MSSWYRNLLGTLAAAALAAGCSHPAQPAFAPVPALSPVPVAVVTPDVEPPQELRLAVAPFNGLPDPQSNCRPEFAVLLNSVYETLVYLDEDLFFKPSLAESWEVSPDATTYTFRLYPGAYFHDGQHLDAHAVKQNLDRVFALGSRDPLAVPNRPDYLGIDELDAYTVRVRFAQPAPNFLTVLSGICYAMLSPASFAYDGSSVGEWPAGTGPFQFAPADSEPGRSIALVRNEDYEWGPALWRQVGARYWGGSGYDASGPCRRSFLAFEHVGPAFLNKVIFQFIDGRAERAAALELGSVDAGLDLAPADAARLERTGRYWVHTAPLPPIQLLTDPVAARLRRIDLQRLTAVEVAASSAAADVLFNAARREVNCLSSGAWGRDTTLYETSIRAMP